MTHQFSGSFTLHTNGDGNPAELLRRVMYMVELLEEIGIPIAVTVSVAQPAPAHAPGHLIPDPAGKAENDGPSPSDSPVVDDAEGVRPYPIDWRGLRYLVDDIDGGRTSWRKTIPATRDQLARCVARAAALRVNNENISMADFDAVRPVWMAKAASLTRSFGESWPILCKRWLAEYPPSDDEAADDADPFPDRPSHS